MRNNIKDGYQNPILFFLILTIQTSLLASLVLASLDVLASQHGFLTLNILFNPYSKIGK